MLKKIKNKYVKVILLGNKTDLEEKRKNNIEKALSLALENNFIFKETSCNQNKNVTDAFETLIEMTYRDKILNNREKMKINISSIILSNENSNLNQKENKVKCYF